MRQIRDLLAETEKQLFVGRKRELGVMRQELANDNAKWRLLHLHGPGGIGKTTLMRHFVREAEIAEFFFLNGEDRFQTPDDFLVQLQILLSDKGHEIPGEGGKANRAAALAEFLNEMAVTRRGVVLFLDSFDKCGAIEKWLREVWLPMLSLHVRVCTAGRYPLEGDWLRAPGWTGLVRNVNIGPLDRTAIHEYIYSRGITDYQTRDAIERFSNGIPLALSLACDSVVEQGPGVLREGSSQRKIIQSLGDILLLDINQSSLQKQLLDIASVFWRFDQDMLREVLGRDIPNEAFEEFCRLPFIGLCAEGGWSVIDAVRQWVKTDLLNRAPETYAFYKRKALIVLQGRLALAPVNQKAQWIVEILYLNENEFLHSYGFRGQGTGFRLRPVREADLPVLEKMWQDWFPTTPPYLPDVTHQEKYIRSVWEVEPSSIFAFWSGDKLAAFYSLTALNEVTRPLFENNPAFGPYVKQTPVQEKEYLMWIGATVPEFEPEALGIVFRHLFSQIAFDKLITSVTPLAYLVEIFLSIGFQRIPWADYTAPNGILYQAVRLDLRDKDLSDSVAGSVQETASNEAISHKEISVLLKKVMMNFYTLELNAQLLHSFLKTGRLKGVLLGGESLASAIRRLILESLDSMAESSEEDKVFERILRLAYIQKIGPHETVAVRLKLPISTYYRYLKKSFDRLAIHLLRRNF